MTQWVTDHYNNSPEANEIDDARNPIANFKNNKTPSCFGDYKMGQKISQVNRIDLKGSPLYITKMKVSEILY